MRRITFRVLIALAIAAIMPAAAAVAQTTSGLTGVVKDNTGAVVPGAIASASSVTFATWAARSRCRRANSFRRTMIWSRSRLVSSRMPAKAATRRSASSLCFRSLTKA